MGVLPLETARLRLQPGPLIPARRLGLRILFHRDGSLGLGCARGAGFYALGRASSCSRAGGDWDVSLVGEAHRSFARTFSTVDGDLLLTPGWGGSAALAGGYSLTRIPLRIGLALSPAYEGAISAQGAGIDSVSDAQLVWNASAQLGWMFGHDSTLKRGLHGSDPAPGPASNVSLSRTLALLFQKRWERFGPMRSPSVSALNRGLELAHELGLVILITGRAPPPCNRCPGPRAAVTKPWRVQAAVDHRHLTARARSLR